MEMISSIILWSTFIVFIAINYYILKSDTQRKIIPNTYLKYLGILGVFLYISQIQLWYLSWHNILLFTIEMLWITILWFILFYFRIWWAWDAKYLIVLSLFLPHINFIYFIWNITIIIILYILANTLWYLVQTVQDPSYRIKVLSLFNASIKKKIEKWSSHTTQKTLAQVIYKIINLIIAFLIFFTIFKILRTTSQLIFIPWDIWTYTYVSIYNYSISSRLYVASIITCTLLITIAIKIVYNYSKNKLLSYISPKNYNEEIIDIWVWILVLVIIFSVNISSVNKEDIFNISSLMSVLIIYITIQGIIWIMKANSKLRDKSIIAIEKLQQWDIIDKRYMKKIIHDGYDIPLLKWWLYDKDFPTNIKNPIDQETCNTIKNIYTQLAKWKYFEPPIQEVQIINNFSFWWILFVWCIITYLYKNSIFSFLLEILYNTIIWQSILTIWLT